MSDQMPEKNPENKSGQTSNPQSNQMKSVLFAVILCVVLSLLLTVVSKGLKPMQQKNIMVDRHKNILKSVGLVQNNKSYTAEDIDKLYSENITQLHVDEYGRVVETNGKEGVKSLPVCIYKKPDGTIESYIIPIDTKGLWGKIHGYLAIKSDGSTISGFTVYKHSETPGLGGEIEQSWFQKNFVGKKIVDQEGEFVSIAVAKGQVKEQVKQDRQTNFVDGISGATLTGKFLSKGIKEILSEYEPVSIKFRKDLIKRGPIQSPVQSPVQPQVRQHDTE